MHLRRVPGLVWVDEETRRANIRLDAWDSDEAFDASIAARQSSSVPNRMPGMPPLSGGYESQF